MRRDLPPHSKPVRFSRLKAMSKSPAHYLGQFTEEREDNAALRLGRLVHALVLGGKIVEWPVERRGNAWKEFALVNEGAEIATSSELTKARRVADSVLRHDDAMSVLQGQRELEIAWMLDGRACGARLDVLGPDYVTELKTTTSAEPGWFTRNGARMGYHAQLSWYMAGARMAFNRPIERAHSVAVEVKHPFVVTVFDVPTATLDEGTRIWRSWFEQLMVCERSDAWPGYTLARAEFAVQRDVEIDLED